MKPRAVPRKPTAADEPASGPWPGRHPALATLLGGVLLWAAFPPLGWSGLAWFAPLPWVWLGRPRAPMPRRSYAWIWGSSVLFWLVLLQGIRQAHPANHLGLLALAAYLGVYLPVFIAALRCTVHRSRVPMWLAAPVIWTGLELLRGGLFTGFSVGLLGHTQVGQPWLLQMADLTGAYGLSFLVMLCAACFTELLPQVRRERRWVPAVVAAGAMLAAGGYGQWRLQTVVTSQKPPLQVALLQGTRDKVFGFNPELEQESFQQYDRLMRQARAAHPQLNLIVWPEGAFTASLPEIADPVEIPAEMDLSPAEARRNIAARQQAFAEKVRYAAAEANGGKLSDHDRYGTHLIVGTTTFHLQREGTRHYNSALWIDPAGNIDGRYFKMHLVMFGEYVPFARYLPWLAALTPIGEGVSPGQAPALFDVHDYRLVPSICFESTVPHVIRRQVRLLQRGPRDSPDILVNITDDGWFWGSSILDLHLACAVFRAVEMRMPFLIAANTGISAVIDGNGRVLQRLPHRQEGFIVASVTRDGRASFYRRWGDLFAGGCLALTAAWILLFAVLRTRPSRRPAIGSTPH